MAKCALLRHFFLQQFKSYLFHMKKHFAKILNILFWNCFSFELFVRNMPTAVKNSMLSAQS